MLEINKSAKEMKQWFLLADLQQALWQTLNFPDFHFLCIEFWLKGFLFSLTERHTCHVRSRSKMAIRVTRQVSNVHVSLMSNMTLVPFQDVLQQAVLVYKGNGCRFNFCFQGFAFFSDWTAFWSLTQALLWSRGEVFKKEQQEMGERPPERQAAARFFKAQVSLIV